jgi:MFS family permease
MHSSTQQRWRKGGVAHSLLHVIVLSFCSQSVQLGAVPVLVALRLDAHGCSVAVLGVIAAAPWIAVLLVGGHVPGLLARARHASVNGIALAISSVAVAVLMLVGDPALVFAANLCLGVGLILRWVACDSWIIALAPDALRGRVIGIYETLMACGMAAGPLIVALFGSSTASPFLACLALLLAAASSLLAVRCTPVPAQAVAGSASVRWSVISLMTSAAFIAGFIETSCVSLLPVLGQQGGWPVARTLALGSFAAGGTVAQLPLGYLADRLGYRSCQLMTAAVVVATGTMLAISWSPARPALLLVELFLLGGAAGGMITLAIIEAGSSGPEQASAAASRIAVAYTVGSIAGPPALGTLATLVGPATFPAAFAVIGAMFCYARLRAGLRDAVESQGSVSHAQARRLT